MIKGDDTFQNDSQPAIIRRAEELLWVIARCDVENVVSHRATALRRLRDLEDRAAELNISDLYRELLRAPSDASGEGR